MHDVDAGKVLLYDVGEESQWRFSEGGATGNGDNPLPLPLDLPLRVDMWSWKCRRVVFRGGAGGGGGRSPSLGLRKNISCH